MVTVDFDDGRVGGLDVYITVMTEISKLPVWSIDLPVFHDEFIILDSINRMFTANGRNC